MAFLWKFVFLAIFSGFNSQPLLFNCEKEPDKCESKGYFYRDNNQLKSLVRGQDEILKEMSRFGNILEEIRNRISLLERTALYKDCKELYDMGRRKSGVYSIYPLDLLHQVKSVQVYCDMDTAGGGWTVIQNRVDGKVNFSRSWQGYKVGFGDVSTSYWIGNDVIHELTKDNSSLLYVSITGKDGTTHYIQYDTFSIAGEDDDYRLYIAGNAFGTLDDRIRYRSGGDNINGMKFSTYDKDNDLSSNHCTDTMGIGGWWFNKCNDAYLNGQYPPGKWSQPWHGTFDDGSKISSTKMMIKRK
ncbi:fibroleukin-like [Saccostrea cucullata]|uniref:fibroleukin-like n=1 Tax=Saccostrea cuccullata TaxID=36930 RepID=UPI002ECFFECD